MSVLIARVEQAFVGALLTENFPWTRFAPDAHRIAAADLTDAVRRRVFTSVLALYQRDHPRPAGRTVVDAVAEDIADAGITRGDLLRLRWSCPDMTHVGHYARLLSAVRLRRHMAAHAERVAAEATDPDDSRHGQLQGLAVALVRSARLHTDLVRAPDGHDVPGPTPTATYGRNADPRAAREENVLATLLRGDPPSGIITALLPPESFRDSQRREIYEAIIGRAYRGAAVDSVLVAWELAEQRAAGNRPGHVRSVSNDAGGPGRRTDSGSQVAAAVEYLDRLPEPRPSSALDDARRMLADGIEDGQYRNPAAGAAGPPRLP